MAGFQDTGDLMVMPDAAKYVAVGCRKMSFILFGCHIAYLDLFTWFEHLLLTNECGICMS